MPDGDPLPAVVDTTECDREPIHIPGAILPHGAMLVLDATRFIVLQAAGDTPGLLGRPIAALLGQTLDGLFTPRQVASLRALVAAFDLAKPRHLLDPLLRAAPDRPLDASLHRVGGSIVVEFEAADPAGHFAADPLAGVREMVEGLDAMPSIQALCQSAAERVRAVAGYDRVMVYRFMEDGSGWVIAEARAAQLEPFLDLHYPASDIPQQARALYRQNWLRLITTVDYTPAPLTPALNPLSGAPLDMSQATLRNVSSVHREYLRNMGVDASMSISLIGGGDLWGLIACHHGSPRVLPRHLRAVCELFGAMVSLLLETRAKDIGFKSRLASTVMLQTLMLNLADADDYAFGLTGQSPNLLDYIACGAAPGDGVASGGVAVGVSGHLTFLGVTPTEAQIEALIAWLGTRMAGGEGIFATDRLAEVWPPAAGFADVGAGILAISVSDAPLDVIIWFRPEVVATTRWAGDPDKPVVNGPNGARLSPRKSFDAWLRTARGRSQPWAAADLDAATDLRRALLEVVLRRINAVAEDRRRAAERDDLLMAELDHRVKNTLASIQALVVQTSGSAATLTSFVEGLNGRIQSMVKAHVLLSKTRWEGVPMEQLLRDALDAFAQAGCAIDLVGVEAMLMPTSGLSLSLAVHELAANAARHGAFSRRGGGVHVSWAPATDGGIDLVWREAGGPRVDAPGPRGFGSALIERALAMETGGSARLRFLPDGLVCDIHLPASSIETVAAGQDSPADITTLFGGAPAMTPAGQPARQQPDALRILLVEDSFLLVMQLEALFEGIGWTVVGPATRKDQAMALAASETFDVALLDINLNGEMSWDVADVLAARGMPFLFSTGYDIATVLPDHLAGRPIIGKPFENRVIEAAVRRVVADARAGRPASETAAWIAAGGAQGEVARHD